MSIDLHFDSLTSENLPRALTLVSEVFPFNKKEIGAAYRDSLDPTSDRMKQRRMLEYFVVTNKSTGNVIAVTGLYNKTEYPPEEAWLAWFCVDPKERGQGIGRKTLEWTINRARSKGYKIFRLYTSTDPNEVEAQHLYESVGLKIYKRERSEEFPEEETIYREKLLE